MTDAEKRDAAWAEFVQTTVGWNKVKSYLPAKLATTHWGKGKAFLDQIGQAPLPGVPLSTRSTTVYPGQDVCAHWLHYNSPTTQVVGTDGNGFRQRVIVWDTAGGQPTALYSGKLMYGLFGFRIVSGSPGRLLNWHTQPDDRPHGWTPPGSGGGVSPLAIDCERDSRGLYLSVEPESGTPLAMIFTPAEVEALVGQWVWLWMELRWGRKDLANKGGVRIWKAGEDTPRVDRQGINTHYPEEHQVNFLQGEYRYPPSAPSSPQVCEHAAARFGRTPKECYEDVPIFHGLSVYGNTKLSISSEIAPRLSSEAAIPLSLRW